MRVLIFILLVLFETSCNNKTHKEAEQNTTPSSYEQDSLTMTEIPSSNQCSCQNDSLFLTELALYWKNQMVICGNIVERRTNDTFLVSACLIKNCKDGKKYHRSNFMKHKIAKTKEEKSMTEREIMKSRGFFRVWNAGNLKYVWSLSDI